MSIISLELSKHLIVSANFSPVLLVDFINNEHRFLVLYFLTNINKFITYTSNEHNRFTFKDEKIPKRLDEPDI